MRKCASLQGCRLAELAELECTMYIELQSLQLANGAIKDMKHQVLLIAWHLADYINPEKFCWYCQMACKGCRQIQLQVFVYNPAGGADHVDNYHYVQSRRFNMHISDKHYELCCYMAGFLTTVNAVKV